MRQIQILLTACLVTFATPWSADAAGTLRSQTGQPLEIVSQRVTVEIDHQVAQTRVIQVFRNPTNRMQEAVYLFPLPEGASVSDFVMETEAARRRAVVVERQKAKQIYDGIVRQKRDPALLEQINRVTFKMSVYPVPANGTVTIELTYDEIVPIEKGSCRYVYPLALESGAASTVSGDFTLTVRIRSSHPITNVTSRNHLISQIRKDTEVVVGLEVMQARLDQDFVLEFVPKSEHLGLAVTAQRDQPGDGTFLVLVTPGSEDDDAVLEKDVVLVMDTSGSMDGVKIEKAKAAMRSFVMALRPGDRFNILTFSSDITRMRGQMVEINIDTQDEAMQFIDNLSAGGGTAIDAALRTALADAAATPRNGDEARPLRLIFVTDGEPTVGECDPKKIIKNAVAANKANARVFAFGVESKADGVLLNLLAAKTGGSAERVHSGSDLDSAVTDLFARVSQPVFSDLSARVEGAGAHKLFPTQPRDLFAGGQVELVGRYSKGGPLTVVVTGTYRGEKIALEGQFELPAIAPGNGAIERLWAKRQISFHQDEILSNGDAGGELRDSIIQLSRRHRVLTPYTAMLILETDEEYHQHGLEPPPKKLGIAKAEGGQRSTDPVAWADGAAAPGRIDVDHPSGGATVPSPQQPVRGPTSGSGRNGYRGPGSTVPPARGAGGASSGSGGPTTPAPGGGPVTPGGASAGPGGGGRGAKKNAGGEGFEQWQFWWEQNSDRHLDLAARLGTGVVQSGSTGFLTGMGRKEAATTARRPSADDVNTIVVPILQGVLTEEDLDIVDSALIALARSVRKESAALVFDDIKAALSSVYPSVRQSAILSLGILGSHDAIPLLTEIVRDTPEGRRLNGTRSEIDLLQRSFAALSLGYIGAPESVEVLIDLIRTSDSTERDLCGTAVIALGLFAERQPEIASFLAGQLGNSKMHRTARALIPITLGRLGQAAMPAMPELLRLLRNRRSDIHLQESCVIALGRLAQPDDHDVLDALYETIQYGINPQARHFAFEALARIGARAAEDPARHQEVLAKLLRFLRTELERPKKMPHSPWAGLALAQIGKELKETSRDRVDLTMAIIEAFERAGNPSYQAAHAISLGLLNAHSAGQLLYQELLNRPDPNLKAQLAVSLGMMRYTDALDTIRQLVIDPRDPGARLQYATALGLMGDAEVLPLLLAELRQAKTLGALSATAKVIGILGDKAAIPTLKEMIEDDSSSGLARGFACSALGRIAEKSESSWKTRISEGGNYRIVLPSLIEILDTP